MKLFMVAFIYICTNGGFVCNEEPITKTWRYEDGKDPSIIKEKCEKWIHEKIWEMPLKPGEIVQARCQLQLIKE